MSDEAGTEIKKCEKCEQSYKIKRFKNGNGTVTAIPTKNVKVIPHEEAEQLNQLEEGKCSQVIEYEIGRK